MPCEAVAGEPRIFFGPPHQHASTPLLADAFLNTTTIPNLNTIVGGVVAPYERFTPDMSGGGSCEVHHCVPDGPAPCSPWLRPFPENTFTKNGSTNFAVARKTGFKNVFARRFWNGRFGYRNKETNNGADHVQGCGDATQTRWRGYTSAIDDTKFLALAIEATWVHTDYHTFEGFPPPPPTVTTETLSLRQSINANSGQLTCSDLALSPDDDRNHALTLYAPALWHWSDVIARMTVEITPVPFAGSKICGDISITIADGSGRTVESVTWDLDAGTFNRSVYDYNSFGAQITLFTESVAVTNTTINYSSTTNEVGSETEPLELSTVLTVTGALQSPLTSAEIYADVKNLLAVWDLADDAQYPWRADLKVSAAPLVSRDENFTTEFLTNWPVKNFGAPVTDAFGAYGEPGWQGHCGVLIAPDPASGNAIIAVDFGAFRSGAEMNSGTGNPFSQCLATGYAIIGGSLPPGISFDTTTGLFSGTIGDDGHYGVTIQVTGVAPAFTGGILGAPKPAGHQNFFDFGFLDFVGCCFMPPENPGFQTWSWYQHGWGMDVGTFNSNTGCHLPLNATQWANYFQSVNKPQGAWLFYNEPGRNFFGANCISSEAESGTLDGAALWACKYAECLEQWPSQNFARPAGDDKFAFDENHVWCATHTAGSGAGSTWTLTNPLSGLPPANDTDFSGIWGGKVVDGFYNVASYSAGTLTLGAKMFDVPSNWTSQSNSDEAFCFGKLRFPACPSLLGRIAITPDMAGTTFTFATPQPTFGLSTMHHEQVDLWDANMTALATNVTATRVDDSQFSVVDAQPAARFVTITGAAKWYTNDTAAKGDYALLQWLADFRSAGEYNRLAGQLDCGGAQIPQPTENTGGGPVANEFAEFTQTPGCLPFLPCAPKVVCISPNGEHFANGITHDFPTTFALDEPYGSKWWAFVQSTMTDLFWQTPHRPCNIEPCAKWIMDGGICAENSPGTCPGDDDFIPGESEPPEYFFSHAPQVEARLSVPCNYGANQNECGPNLPAGIQIGWLSPVFYSEGDIALPPQPPGAESEQGRPAGATTAWDLHAALCASAAGCRFNYQPIAC